MANDKLDIESIYYLSPLQEGLLFHAVSDADRDPYFTQSCYVIEGALDVSAFERAWQDAVGRHAILRTAFVWQEVKRPVQVVRRSAPLTLEQRDLRQLDPAAREHEIADWLARDRARGFELVKAPLMRLALLRSSETRWMFVNSHHHLLLDGWSLALLLREVLARYTELRTGSRARSPLPPPGPTYRDYVGWIQKRDAAAAERFWSSLLEGFVGPTPLPLDGSASAPVDDDAYPYAEQAELLSQAETLELAAFARQLRVTPNTLVQGAWALLLQRHAGVSDVVFGATVAGRPPELAGAENIVGLLINTLPVRVCNQPEERIGAWLARLQDTAGQSREFEWTPLSSISRLRAATGARGGFDSIVVFDSYPEDEAGNLPDDLQIAPLPGASVRRGDVLLVTGRNNYPLSLIVEPNQRLGFVFCYDRARFSDAAVACLRRQFRTLLSEMLAKPQAALGELSMIDDAERRRLLAVAAPSGPGPARDMPTVDALFRAQVNAHPGRLALICGDERSSYAELGARVTRMADQLAALGVGIEDRVALCVERSAALIVGIFGVLEAGAAYVPLDPKFPLERLRSVVNDSGARAVLCQRAHAASFEGLGVPVIDVDDLRPDAPHRTPSAHSLRARPLPGHLAYLIYTSGSTGRPKGVGVEHRQLVSYVSAVLERLKLEPSASLGYVSTVAADLGHTSLFGALCSGRTLHVLSNELAFSPEGMAETLRRDPLDALKIVPSHLQALLHAARPGDVLPRRCLVLGGESASRALLEQVRALAPECRVVNHYGPTETTVGALTWELPSTESVPPRMPIGRPLNGLSVYVLDASLAPVAVGLVGELYIGGAGVARGYHERPALTAERFIPDPFGGPGRRLYRTGDRARWRADGSVEFLGRADHQIKLRGHRIELGEIEAQLRECAGVREAVVIVHDRLREDGEERRRLVAYVVVEPGAEAQPLELAADLGRRLPDYMVPSVIVPLGQLPLTDNGKIDRAALPEPEATPAPRANAFVAPRTDTERVLAELWADVLGLPQVSVVDDFFALGGDSILSLQIIARANQRGVRVTPKLLFAHPTVEALAASLGADPAAPTAALAPPVDAPALPAPFSLARLPGAELSRWRELHGAALEDVYPASAVQQGMLLHGLLRPEDGPYLNQVVCRFANGLDVAAFAAAWQRLAAAHPALRTSFVLDGVNEPHQLVWSHAELPIERIDCRGSTPEQQAALLEARLRADRSRGLRFEQRPLMRLTVMRIGETCDEVIWTVHHAILDGWCQARLVKDWIALYAGGQPATPLDTAPPYRLYMAWLERRDMARAEAFFRGYLQGFVAPLRLPSPERDAGAPSGCRESRVQLSAELTRALEQRAKSSGVTLNTLVQAAWALTLSRHGAGDDVAFGVTVSGRPADLPGSDAVLGVFINSLPLRLRLDPAQRGRDWLRQIQDTNLELREHEATPLADVQRWSELGAGSSLFDTLLVFQNYPLDAALEEHARDLGVEVRAEEAWTHYPLTLFVTPGAVLTLIFSQDLAALDDRDLAGLMAGMQEMLQRLSAQPDARIAEWLAPASAELEALAARNATDQCFAADQSLLANLADRARRHPERVAVVAGQRAVTYGELERRSNQLAHHLRALGAGRESWVGLALPRTTELLVAVLGVLKAGAAYVPLDPSYPRERLAYMLDDARVELLLTDSSLLARLPACAARTLCLDLAAAELERMPCTTVEAVAPGESLAYAIYTSGSTGQPKGVMVRRAALDNFLAAMHARLAPPEGVVVLASTSLSFDIAVLELLLPLAVGGRVVIAPGESPRDPEQLLELLRASGATWMQATPSAWKMLLELDHDFIAGLTVLCGGEALSPELARELRRAETAWNLYGPTETTVWSSAQRLRGPEAAVSLGEAIANTTLYVLDARRQPVPVGVAGELYIGGAGLARGYARRPALTAERFIPDPFGAVAGGRLYATGDRVRLHVDGHLEFLGRLDHQLKIRGHRIELGEIESALRASPDVADAAALARRDSDETTLVAYVIAAAGASLDAARLRTRLAETLPEHMLPSAIVELQRWPLTPNGKLDRKALPAPDRSDRSLAVPPRSATEAVLADIWREVLGLSVVGVFDNFFELGGHSLMATRVVSRARARCQAELPLRALFEQPTIAQLARWLDGSRAAGATAAESPPLSRQPRQGSLPLSFAQQRLWFLEQLPGAAGRMTIPFALRLSGALDRAALRAAIAAVIERHEILRTAYLSEAGEPRQHIAPAVSFELPLLTSSAIDASSPDGAIEREAARAAAEGFDLTSAPPLRARLLRLEENEHALIVALHHIAVDAWSIGILIDDLARAYTAAVRAPGTAPHLDVPALQYADYAAWQRQHLAGARWQESLAYWRRELAGSPTSLRLPGFSAAAGVAGAARLVRHLPSAESRALAQVAEERSCTPFMLLWTALAVVIHQQTAAQDLLIGTDAANRQPPETESMVGFFVNQLVLRARLDGTTQLGELLARCQRTALGAYQHGELPFDALVADLLGQRSGDETPFFQIKLLFDGVPRRDLSLPGLEIRELQLAPTGADVDLLINVSVHDDGWSLVFDHREGTYPGVYIAELAELYLAALAHLPRLLDARVSELVAALDGLQREHMAHAQQATIAPSGPARKRKVVGSVDAASLTERKSSQ
jgi:amino acid adenylation domain-containing protein